MHRTRLLEGVQRPGIAEFDASRLRCCQCCFCALRYLVALMLRERSEHVQHEPVGMGIVATNELRPALHQRRDKSDIAAQPVELRNYECGFLPAALLQG